jgi:hypothetical protein
MRIGKISFKPPRIPAPAPIKLKIQDLSPASLAAKITQDLISPLSPPSLPIISSINASTIAQLEQGGASMGSGLTKVAVGSSQVLEGAFTGDKKEINRGLGNIETGGQTTVAGLAAVSIAIGTIIVNVVEDILGLDNNQKNKTNAPAPSGPMWGKYKDQTSFSNVEQDTSNLIMNAQAKSMQHTVANTDTDNDSEEHGQEQQSQANQPITPPSSESSSRERDIPI